MILRQSLSETQKWQRGTNRLQSLKWVKEMTLTLSWYRLCLRLKRGKSPVFTATWINKTEISCPIWRHTKTCSLIHMGLPFSSKCRSLCRKRMPIKLWYLLLTVRKGFTSFAVSVLFLPGTSKGSKVLRSPQFFIITTAVSCRGSNIHILPPLYNSEKVQLTVKKAAKSHRRNSLPASVYQESKMVTSERQSPQWERTYRNNHCSFLSWLSLGYWPLLLHRLHC